MARTPAAVGIAEYFLQDIAEYSKKIFQKYFDQQVE